MGKPLLSVVVPAYNEVHNLKDGVLVDIYIYLIKQKYDWEVLIVDDGSLDKTREMVAKYINNKKGFRLLKEPHRGKGGTVVAGVLAAKGDIILFTDMDQSTSLNQIENFWLHFGYEPKTGKLLNRKHSADIVIGSRSGREGAPLIRKSMASGFSILRAIVLKLPYKDTQCGFKAFKKEAARQIFSRLKVFKEKAVEGAAVTAGFDLEILYIARKLNLKVEEVPVVWQHKGSKRVSAVKDSWQGLTDLVKVRLNALQGKYNV
ncbi:glycosyltransferase [Candidatus Woesebacteria bacterium]|nr:MAG: glycosyltransferase [Candidatus Woesebacteria bacterium]